MVIWGTIQPQSAYPRSSARFATKQPNGKNFHPVSQFSIRPIPRKGLTRRAVLIALPFSQSLHMDGRVAAMHSLAAADNFFLQSVHIVVRNEQCVGGFIFPTTTANSVTTRACQTRQPLNYVGYFSQTMEATRARLE